MTTSRRRHYRCYTRAHQRPRRLGRCAAHRDRIYIMLCVCLHCVCTVCTAHDPSGAADRTGERTIGADAQRRFAVACPHMRTLLCYVVICVYRVYGIQLLAVRTFVRCYTSYGRSAVVVWCWCARVYAFAHLGAANAKIILRCMYVLEPVCVCVCLQARRRRRRRRVSENNHIT